MTARKAQAIIDQLADSLGRHDEQPNIALAIRIVKAGDSSAVRELIELLSHAKMGIRNDAIKALYETGERNPDMIVPYAQDFLKLLHHKDNRMKWGAMCALSAISSSYPEQLAPHLVTIVEAMDAGTVITRDHGVRILANVSHLKKYHDACMDLLLEQIEKAPVNQVPMYAEKTTEAISQPYVKNLISILKARKDVLEVPSKAKRIEKLIRTITSSSGKS